MFCVVSYRNWILQAESEVKEGPEVEDAKKTVEEVEKQFPTEDAWFSHPVSKWFGVYSENAKMQILTIVRIFFFHCYLLLLIHFGDFSFFISFFTPKRSNSITENLHLQNTHF